MVLLVLSTAKDLERLWEKPAFAWESQALFNFTDPALRQCVVRLPAHAALPPGAIDRVPDGNDCKPRTNAAIEGAVLAALPFCEPIPVR